MLQNNLCIVQDSGCQLAGLQFTSDTATLIFYRSDVGTVYNGC